MKYDGINALARVLKREMATDRKAGNTAPLDFGTITSNRSLLLDTFPIPIPPSDYMVCRSAAYKSDIKTTTTQAGIDAHTHDVPLFEEIRSVQPGDRVLVAWVDNDAVVIDIILSATAL